MKTFGKVLVVGAVMIGLGGCAATWDIDGVAAANTASNSAFAQALHAHYVERARFERGEEDWRSVAMFVERARTAATGTPPAPLAPADWGLGGTADLEAQYARLTAALATTAPQDAPDACARAQTWFEHWNEQRREGHQPDHIAQAQAAYDSAIVDCVPKAAAAAAVAPPPQPKAFVVYFPFDSAALIGEAKAIVRAVADFFKTEDMRSVEVVGHTDTAGTNAYNDALSQRRADAVKGSLVDLGVAADAIATDARGEEEPISSRADGVKDPKNRRVEILVQP